MLIVRKITKDHTNNDNKDAVVSRTTAHIWDDHRNISGIFKSAASASAEEAYKAIIDAGSGYARISKR